MDQPEPTVPAPVRSEPSSRASSYSSDCLRGRVAVVTGAGGGLGGAIAARLAGMGATLALVDLQAPSLPPGHREGLSLACDITDAGAVTAMARQVERELGRCDVLVNNAGIKTPPVALEDYEVADWDKVFGVNVRGAFLCARALVGMMLAQRCGSIVNMASIGARTPTRVGAYAASKAAISGLTRQMAVEWGPCGIRANSVSPGMVRTPMSDSFYRDPEQAAARVAMLPVRRIGIPDEIADAVAFLCSDASSFVSGHDLVVDGGFLVASLFHAQVTAAP